MDSKVNAYSKKLPRKLINERRNSPLDPQVKPVPYGNPQITHQKIEKINLNYYIQNQVIKVESNRNKERTPKSPLRSDFYQKYNRIAQSKSPLKNINNETVIQSLRSGRLKTISNLKKGSNRRISSLIHSLLSSVNNINQPNKIEEDAPLTNRSRSNCTDNSGKIIKIRTYYPSLGGKKMQLNKEVFLNNKITQLINEKNNRQVKIFNHNEKEEIGLRTNPIKDKLSENFVTFLKKHRYSALLIGSKRYEGKSGEYYLASQNIDNIKTNCLSDRYHFTLGNQEQSNRSNTIKKIEIDLGQKSKYERNWELPSSDQDLTPIPTRRNVVSNRQEKEEYLNAERTAVLIRRIEYSLKLKGIKRKYSDEMREGIGLRNKIILIQRWWRKMFRISKLKNNYALFIQKIFRGYFARKALTSIINDFNRFYLFFSKIYQIINNYNNKILFRYIYKNFAYLSQAKYISSKINIIIKHVKRFLTKRLFRRELLIKTCWKPISKRLNRIFLILKDHYNSKGEAQIIQKNWRGFQFRNNYIYIDEHGYNPLLKIFFKYKYSLKYSQIKEYVIEAVNKFKRLILKTKYSKKMLIFIKKLKKHTCKRFYRVFLRKLEEYRFIRLKLKIIARNLKKIFPLYIRSALSKYFRVWKKEYRSTKALCNKVKFLYRNAFKFIYWNKFIKKIQSPNLQEKMRFLFNKLDYLKMKNAFYIFKQKNKLCFLQENKITNILNSKHYMSLKIYLEKLKHNSENNLDIYLSKFGKQYQACTMIEKVIKRKAHETFKSEFFLSNKCLLKIKKVVDFYKKSNMSEKLKFYFQKYGKIVKKLSHIIFVTKLRIKNLIKIKYANDSVILKNCFSKLYRNIINQNKLVERRLLDFYKKYKNNQTICLSYYFKKYFNNINKLQSRQLILKKQFAKNDLNNLRGAFIRIDYSCKEEKRKEKFSKQNKNTQVIYSFLKNIFNRNINYIFKRYLVLPSQISKRFRYLDYKISHKTDMNMMIYSLRKYLDIVRSLIKQDQTRKLISLTIRNQLIKLSTNSKESLIYGFNKLKRNTFQPRNKVVLIKEGLIRLIRRNYIYNLRKTFKRYSDISYKNIKREEIIKKFTVNQTIKSLRIFFFKMKSQSFKQTIMQKMKGLLNMIKICQLIIDDIKKEIIVFNFLLPLKRLYKCRVIIDKIQNKKEKITLKECFYKINSTHDLLNSRYNSLKNIISKSINKEKIIIMSNLINIFQLWKGNITIFKFKINSVLKQLFKKYYLNLKENILYSLRKLKSFPKKNLEVVNLTREKKLMLKSLLKNKISSDKYILKKYLDDLKLKLTHMNKRNLVFKMNFTKLHSLFKWKSLKYYFEQLKDLLSYLEIKENKLKYIIKKRELSLVRLKLYYLKETTQKIIIFSKINSISKSLPIIQSIFNKNKSDILIKYFLMPIKIRSSLSRRIHSKIRKDYLMVYTKVFDSLQKNNSIINKNNNLLGEMKQKLASKLKETSERRNFVLIKKYFEKLQCNIKPLRIIENKDDNTLVNVNISNSIKDLINRRAYSQKEIFMEYLKRRFSIIKVNCLIKNAIDSFNRFLLMYILNYSYKRINNNLLMKIKETHLKNIHVKQNQKIDFLNTVNYFNKLKNFNYSSKFKMKFFKQFLKKIISKKEFYSLRKCFHRFMNTTLSIRIREKLIKLILNKKTKETIRKFFKYFLISNKKVSSKDNELKVLTIGFDCLSVFFYKLSLENFYYNLIKPYRIVSKINEILDNNLIINQRESKIIFFHKLLNKSFKKNLQLPYLTSMILNKNLTICKNSFFEKMKTNLLEFLFSRRIALCNLLYKNNLSNRIKRYYLLHWKENICTRKVKYFRKIQHSLIKENEKSCNAIFLSLCNLLMSRYIDFFKVIKIKSSPNRNLKSYLSPNMKKLNLLFYKNHFTKKILISKYFKIWKNHINRSEIFKSALILQKVFEKIKDKNKEIIKNSNNCDNVIYCNIQKLKRIIEYKDEKLKSSVSSYFIKFKKISKFLSLIFSVIKCQQYYRYRLFRIRLGKIINSKNQIKHLSINFFRKELLTGIRGLKRIFNNINVLIIISNIQKSKLISILKSHFQKVEMSFMFYWMYERIKNKYSRLYKYDFFCRLKMIKVESCVKFIQFYWNFKKKLIRFRRIQEILYNSVYEITFSKLKILKSRFLKWLKEVQMYKLSKSIGIINKYIYAYLIRKRLRKILHEYSEFLCMKITLTFYDLAKKMYTK